MLSKERTNIIIVISTVDDGIGKFHKLLLKKSIVALFPHILKHTVNVYFVYTK